MYKRGGYLYLFIGVSYFFKHTVVFFNKFAGRRLLFLPKAWFRSLMVNEL